MLFKFTLLLGTVAATVWAQNRQQQFERALLNGNFCGLQVLYAAGAPFDDASSNFSLEAVCAAVSKRLLRQSTDSAAVADVLSRLPFERATSSFCVTVQNAILQRHPVDSIRSARDFQQRIVRDLTNVAAADALWSAFLQPAAAFIDRVCTLKLLGVDRMLEFHKRSKSGRSEAIRASLRRAFFATLPHFYAFVAQLTHADASASTPELTFLAGLECESLLRMRYLLSETNVTRNAAFLRGDFTEAFAGEILASVYAAACIPHIFEGRQSDDSGGVLDFITAPLEGAVISEQFFIEGLLHRLRVHFVFNVASFLEPVHDADIFAMLPFCIALNGAELRRLVVEPVLRMTFVEGNGGDGVSLESLPNAIVCRVVYHMLEIATMTGYLSTFFLLHPALIALFKSRVEAAACETLAHLDFCAFSRAIHNGIFGGDAASETAAIWARFCAFVQKMLFFNAEHFLADASIYVTCMQHLQTIYRQRPHSLNYYGVKNFVYHFLTVANDAILHFFAALHAKVRIVFPNRLSASEVHAVVMEIFFQLFDRKSLLHLRMANVESANFFDVLLHTNFVQLLFYDFGKAIVDESEEAMRTANHRTLFKASNFQAIYARLPLVVQHFAFHVPQSSNETREMAMRRFMDLVLGDHSVFFTSRSAVKTRVDVQFLCAAVASSAVPAQLHFGAPFTLQHHEKVVRVVHRLPTRIRCFAFNHEHRNELHRALIDGSIAPHAKRPPPFELKAVAAGGDRPVDAFAYGMFRAAAHDEQFTLKKWLLLVVLSLAALLLVGLLSLWTFKNLVGFHDAPLSSSIGVTKPAAPSPAKATA